jgi:hypothetical protein
MRPTICICVLSYAMLIGFTACTFNFSMVHTEGTAADIVDDTTSTSPTISPNVSIPVSAIPGVK